MVHPQGCAFCVVALVHEQVHIAAATAAAAVLVTAAGDTPVVRDLNSGAALHAQTGTSCPLHYSTAVPLKRIVVNLAHLCLYVEKLETCSACQVSKVVSTCCHLF